MKKIYICSLILSILHSILFWNKQIGISMILFTITTLLFCICLLEKGKKIQDTKELFWSVPIILLSATYFIFNNIIFRILNIIAIITLMTMLIIGITKKTTTIKGYIIKAMEIVFKPIELIDFVIEQLKNMVTYNIEKTENNNLLKKIIKSFLIALPIVLVVIILLASADSIFRETFSIFGNVFKNIKISELFFRTIVAIILFFYFSCFIVNLIKKDSPYNKEESIKDINMKIDNFTINTILVLLNIIYIIFSVIQFQNLFTHLGNTQEFNFAQYARQGFFQLTLVSFINFAIIFIATKNKQETIIKKVRMKKALEIMLILFTIVIIASSFIRMYLYEQAYGYTHLRLFVYAILITELICMLPIITYILGVKFNLLKTIMIIITAMYVGLNYINIDKIIAKNNIDKYLAEENSAIEKQLEYQTIDLDYLKNSTRTDAFLQMERLLKAQDKDVVEKVKNYMDFQKIKYKTENEDWQEFNLSVELVKNY